METYSRPQSQHTLMSSQLRLHDIKDIITLASIIPFSDSRDWFNSLDLQDIYFCGDTLNVQEVSLFLDNELS